MLTPSYADWDFEDAVMGKPRSGVEAFYKEHITDVAAPSSLHTWFVWAANPDVFLVAMKNINGSAASPATPEPVVYLLSEKSHNKLSFTRTDGEYIHQFQEGDICDMLFRPAHFLVHCPANTDPAVCDKLSAVFTDAGALSVPTPDWLDFSPAPLPKCLATAYLYA
ncbi:MAG: hypothetical protein V4621_05495 [Pseudomonadota bacterium]